MTYSKIGDTLRKLRHENHCTLEQVGKVIGISKQTLYKYENGIINNIPSDKIEALAHFYRVSPSVIMGWSDDWIQENMPPLQEQLDATVDKLVQEGYYDDMLVNLKTEYARKEEGILLDAAKDLTDEELESVINIVNQLRNKGR